MISRHISQVLIAPIVSEKSVSQNPFNVTTFWVKTTANKQEIKRAVEHFFKVKVAGVRTTTLKGKTRRFREIEGRHSDRKKAYVRLMPGQTIDLGIESAT